jgi:aminoglycoside phosphotransferase (APT) family kinase protein
LAQFEHYLSLSGLVDYDPVMLWLKNQRERTLCTYSSVIHFDFHQNNILEDVNGKLYVIDWTSAEISDYRFDLAWTLILSLAYQGESGRAMILDAYQRQMGQSVPALDVFEVAALLRRIGTVMISMHAGAEALGLRPEAVDVMRQEVEPLTRLYAHLCRLTGLDLPGIGEFIKNLC